jgi:hypothetical protein
MEPSARNDLAHRNSGCAGWSKADGLSLLAVQWTDQEGQILNETDWAAVRDEMEVARRDFINASRREVVQTKEAVDDVPVARPSLAETRQLIGPTSIQGGYASSEPGEPVDEL